jgi:hypothetical protein
MHYYFPPKMVLLLEITVLRMDTAALQSGLTAMHCEDTASYAIRLHLHFCTTTRCIK